MEKTEAPPWADRLLPHLRGAGMVVRELVIVGLYLAALVLLAWVVVGVATGFLSISMFIGAGGIGGGAMGVVKWLRKHRVKP